MKIRAKITLALLLVTLVPLGAFAVAVFVFNQPQVERIGSVAQWQVQAVLVLVAVLVPVAGYLLSRRMSKALIEISDAVSQVEGGEFSVDLPYANGSDEIARLATSINAMTERLKAYDALNIEKIQALNRELDAANRELQQLATHDSLTGLVTVRVFHETLEAEFRRSSRNGRPISVLLLDIDHFKRINDSYGRQAGDTVLRQVSALLRETVRSTDCAARYGGDEMSVILPETKGADAYKLAEKLRKLIMIETFDISDADGEPLEVTTSIGVAATDVEMAGSGEELVKRADQALYRARESGRNRVETG